MHRQLHKITLFCFLGLVSCLFLAGSVMAAPATTERNPAWAIPVSLQGSDNFFEVAPGLYRSAQPDAAGMKAYEAMGIRTVINLRANHSDDTEARGTSLILQRIPINTWSIDDDDVVAVLALLRTEQKPILLHCQHGADRTGLMIAMYRMVEQGWNKQDALDELQNGGYGFHSIWVNIPKYIKNVDIERIRELVDKKTAGTGTSSL